VSDHSGATTEAKWYTRVGEEFVSHGRTEHRKHEYVRGDAHTNTAENYFSILKRGIYGVYHHVSEAHLPRYLAEFDFRYSNRAKLGVSDGERAAGYQRRRGQASHVPACLLNREHKNRSRVES
jgi:ISXO2-like transposase domain